MQRRFCLIATAALALPARFALADDAADFWRAVAFNQDWHVARMLKAGTDPNQRNADGETPLLVALREDADRVAALLIADAKVDIELRNKAGESPLMMAAVRGKTPLMRALLARGAQVNHAGWTPLHYACSQIELEPARLLLDAKADMNARSPNGTTPMMMAARYGGIDQVRLLLARGADKTLRNDRDLTAADFAKAAGRDDSLIAQLR